MINAVLYGALGFFIAGLLALLLAPPLWNRAVRFTTRKLEATMPMTSAEITADKDQLRAQYAVEIARLEAGLAKAKEKAVRQLVETSKRRVRIDELESRIEELVERLQVTEDANRALEQTLQRRLPEMERQVAVNRQAADETENANIELRHRLEVQSAALQEARETLRWQRTEIDRLRHALEADAVPVNKLFGRSDSALAKANRQLTARLSALEEEVMLSRQRDQEDYLLREEMRKLARLMLQSPAEQADALAELLPEAAPEMPEPEMPEPEMPEPEMPEPELPEPEISGTEIAAPEAAGAGSSDPEPGAATEDEAPAGTANPVPDGSVSPRGRSLAERLSARRNERKESGSTAKASESAEQNSH